MASKITITAAAMRKHGPVTLASEFCCALRDRAFSYQIDGRRECADVTHKLASDVQTLLDQYRKDIAAANIGSVLCK